MTGRLARADELFVCLDCGREGLLEALRTCDNVIPLTARHDYMVCPKCAHMSEVIDMSVCGICHGQACLRCIWEYNYAFYCDDCISVCTRCGGPTYERPNVRRCGACEAILCQDCICHPQLNDQAE